MSSNFHFCSMPMNLLPVYFTESVRLLPQMCQTIRIACMILMINILLLHIASRFIVRYSSFLISRNNLSTSFVWETLIKVVPLTDLQHHLFINHYGLWMLYLLISQIHCPSFLTEVWLGYIMTGVNLSIHTHGLTIFFTWVISWGPLREGKQACLLIVEEPSLLIPWHPLVLQLYSKQALHLFLYCRCHIIEVAAEIDRILRPGRWFMLQDTIEVIRKMEPVLRSLHYRTTIVKQQFLVAAKGFWRPGSTGSQSWWFCFHARWCQGLVGTPKVVLTLLISITLILLVV
jgi:hypothetical protein